jgi:hypothetical protein
MEEEQVNPPKEIKPFYFLHVRPDPSNNSTHRTYKTCQSLYWRRYRPSAYCLHPGYSSCRDLRAEKPWNLRSVQRQSNSNKKGRTMPPVQEKNMRWSNMHVINPTWRRFPWNEKTAYHGETLKQVMPEADSLRRTFTSAIAFPPENARLYLFGQVPFGTGWLEGRRMLFIIIYSQISFSPFLHTLDHLSFLNTSMLSSYLDTPQIILNRKYLPVSYSQFSLFAVISGEYYFLYHTK